MPLRAHGRLHTGAVPQAAAARTTCLRGSPSTELRASPPCTPPRRIISTARECEDLPLYRSRAGDFAYKQNAQSAASAAEKRREREREREMGEREGDCRSAFLTLGKSTRRRTRRSESNFGARGIKNVAETRGDDSRCRIFRASAFNRVHRVP